MPDMLVKLYDLPDLGEIRAQMKKQNIVIRRGLAPEKHAVLEWIGKHFRPHWVSEADVAFANHPVTCLIAVHETTGEMVGFACYEATLRNYFGPIGVDPKERGRGIGKALFLESLYGLKELGYGYCIIGGAGPVDFYAQSVGATVIEGSSPGNYRGMLR